MVANYDQRAVLKYGVARGTFNIVTKKLVANMFFAKMYIYKLCVGIYK